MVQLQETQLATLLEFVSLLHLKAIIVIKLSPGKPFKKVNLGRAGKKLQECKESKYLKVKTDGLPIPKGTSGR